MTRGRVEMPRVEAGGGGLRRRGDAAKATAMASPNPAMAPVRVEIDRIDRALVALLAERARMIDAAVAVKSVELLPARIDARVAEVIANVRVAATAEGLDADFVEALWRRIIEWSIAREERAMATESGRDG